jgi:hypothetical protein
MHNAASKKNEAAAETGQQARQCKADPAAQDQQVPLPDVP